MSVKKIYKKKCKSCKLYLCRGGGGRTFATTKQIQINE
jgi:hypothetical protein